MGLGELLVGGVSDGASAGQKDTFMLTTKVWRHKRPFLQKEMWEEHDEDTFLCR